MDQGWSKAVHVGSGLASGSG